MGLSFHFCVRNYPRSIAIDPTSGHRNPASSLKYNFAKLATISQNWQQGSQKLKVDANCEGTACVYYQIDLKVAVKVELTDELTNHLMKLFA